jgi:hypothetical protein
MKWIVNNPDGYATRLTSFAGVNLTLVNSSAVDVYYDVQKGGGSINSTAPGVIPVGTKIAATGGTVQFTDSPDEIWVRAISQTVLDVQGNAPQAPGIIPTALAGDARGNQNVTPKSEFPAKKTISIGAPTTGRFFQGLEKKYFHKRMSD